uniref:Pept_C1 domain-containing protein n=1 Tax=Parastrongyloides trichosuri TaxID=131310 RepID=A0A0N4ZRS6_PARTI
MKISYDQRDKLYSSKTINIVTFKDDELYIKTKKHKRFNFKVFLIACVSSFLISTLIFKLINLYSTEFILDKSTPINFPCDLNIMQYDVLFINNEITDKEKKNLCNFIKFINDFNKSYISNEEKLRRFEYYLKNIDEIEKADKEDDYVEFKPNKYSDWSDEELKKLLLTKEEIDYIKDIPETEDAFLPMEASNSHLNSNTSFDWRDRKVITPVKDQGNCGSCAFFANVAVIESLYAISGKPLTRLSEQELLDCDLKENGCNGANRVNIFEFAQRHGVVWENYYQYKGIQSECKNMSNRPRVYISGYKFLGRNEDSWIKYLETTGPFSVGVQVPKQMYYYSSGIFDPSEDDCKNKSMGSHAMAVIGYGEENGKKYWLLKNSWGQGYGFENGYLKMRRGINSCGIALYAYGAKI